MAAAGDDNGILPEEAPPQFDDIDDRVYRAVISKQSVEVVQERIEELARGQENRRAAAVDKAGTNPETGEPETPLEAAHRLELGPVMGALLEAGAHLDPVFECGTTALAQLLWLGEIESIRALLRDPNRYDAKGLFQVGDARLTLVHVCIIWAADVGVSKALECLNLVVEQGGADVNARSEGGHDRDQTALHYLAAGCYRHPDPQAVLSALVKLGADVNAQDQRGFSPIFECDQPEFVKALIDNGASTAVASSCGWTPLMWAIRNFKGEEVIQVLLHHSSDETLRAKDDDGYTAVDHIATFCEESTSSLDSFQIRLALTLRKLGVAVTEEKLGVIMRGGNQYVEEVNAEEAWRARSAGTGWRNHERMVKLAFDHLELREAEEGVRQRERRVRELEEELAARGERLEEEEEEEPAVAAAAASGGEEKKSETKSGGGGGEEEAR